MSSNRSGLGLKKKGAAQALVDRQRCSDHEADFAPPPPGYLTLGAETGIAEETGASLQQIRSAVARMVAKRKARFEGKTAAGRYWARG